MVKIEEKQQITDIITTFINKKHYTIVFYTMLDFLQLIMSFMTAGTDDLTPHSPQSPTKAIFKDHLKRVLLLKN